MIRIVLSFGTIPEVQVRDNLGLNKKMEEECQKDVCPISTGVKSTGVRAL